MRSGPCWIKRGTSLACGTRWGSPHERSAGRHEIGGIVTQRWLALLLLLAGVASGCDAGSAPSAPPPSPPPAVLTVTPSSENGGPTMTLTLTSSAFTSGNPIPRPYT